MTHQLATSINHENDKIFRIIKIQHFSFMNIYLKNHIKTCNILIVYMKVVINEMILYI